jgi:hypothetical protein
LISLLPFLTKDFLEQAQALIEAIERDVFQVELNAALAVHLPHPDRAQLMSEMIDTARNIKDDAARTQALTALVAQVTGPDRAKIMAETLDTARAIKEDAIRARALAYLVPIAPEQNRAKIVVETLEATELINDEDGTLQFMIDGEIEIWKRSQVLTATVPYMPPELLPRALAIAQAIEDEQDLSSFRDRLASWQGRTNLEWHARSGQINQEDYEQIVANTVTAFTENHEIFDRHPSRDMFIQKWGLKCAKLPQSTLYSLWCQVLPVQARRSRKDLLAFLTGFIPVIEALGGRRALEETAVAVKDVGRWWP